METSQPSSADPPPVSAVFDDLAHGEYLKAFSDLSPHLGHKTQIAILTVAIAVVASIGLARLVEIWRRFRARRAILEEQKLFNEILKIRYEIEVLRKQHDLPDLVAADRVLAAGSHAASPGAEGDARTHRLLGFALPELPAFSFDLLSVVGLSRKRPDPRMPRVFWSLKWLVAILVTLLVLLVLDFMLLPQPRGQNDPTNPSGMVVGIILVLLGTAGAAYMLTVALYNLILAVVRASRQAPVKS